MEKETTQSSNFEPNRKGFRTHGSSIGSNNLKLRDFRWKDQKKKTSSSLTGDKWISNHDLSTTEDILCQHCGQCEPGEEFVLTSQL